MYLPILLVVLGCIRQSCSEFTLNILHINDLHARFEQTNVDSGRCLPKQEQTNQCFGGLARIHYKVEELRKTEANTLFVCGGDNFQGTVWYSVHKWKPFAYFLNRIGLEAMVLGNHEFDGGIAGIVPFLDNVTFPVLAANIDDSQVRSFQGKAKPSVIIEKNGTRIGIIGYITTETAESSKPGQLLFLDEVESVRKEAKSLKRQGVDIIIALGHAGFDMDKEVARQVAEVDVVVGGHTNTFFYNGDVPSTESPAGTYPFIVRQESDKMVPVVQAYAFGKYLGHLQLKFDNHGDVLEWSGNAILLDGAIPQDPEILEELMPWRQEIDKVTGRSVGRTFVYLDGSRFTCGMKECNMGNLIADAIVHQFAVYPEDEKLTRTTLAVVDSGSIRSSIDETAYNGSITVEDILLLLPYENLIEIVELEGQYVKQMFEQSVAFYDIEGRNPPQSFLQVSGFRVVYDISQAPGSRLVRLDARCTGCRVPAYEPVNDKQIYSIAMQSYLAKGGSVFSDIPESRLDHHSTGLLDTDVMIEYIEKMSPIYQGVEKRIQFFNANNSCVQGTCSSEAKEPSEIQPRNSDSTTSSLDITSGVSHLMYVNKIILVLPFIIVRVAT